MKYVRVLERYGRAMVIGCVGLVIASIGAGAEPLAKPACDALKDEHQVLIASDIAADIERGAEWAEKNLGQLRLQQMARLFEIEEQLAFRCRGTPLKTAVFIPSLKTVTEVKLRKNSPLATVRSLGGLRISRVPPPVKRPKLLTTSEVSPEQTGQAAATPKAVNAAPSNVRRAETEPAGPASVTTSEKAPAADAKTNQLPKVIRLQPSQTDAKPTPKRRQVQAKRRRKRKPKVDTYVPPPANPGYQPSLTSP